MDFSSIMSDPRSRKEISFERAYLIPGRGPYPVAQINQSLIIIIIIITVLVILSPTTASATMEIMIGVNWLAKNATGANESLPLGLRSRGVAKIKYSLKISQ